MKGEYSFDVEKPIEKEVYYLRRKGFSFREIADQLGNSVKTAWRYGRDVTFSKEGKVRYETEVDGIRKGIAEQEDYITEEKARIVAHLLFDGLLHENEYHYNIRYTNASEQLVREFVKYMKLVYGLDNLYWEGPDGGGWYRVTYRSRGVYDDLLSYTPSFFSSDGVSKIPLEIMESDKSVQLEFLRAFWRDEGSISSSRKLIAELRSEIIIEQFKSLHGEFNLNPRIAPYTDRGTDSYKLYFPREHEILEKFHRLNIFGPSVVTRGRHAGRKKQMFWPIF